VMHSSVWPKCTLDGWIQNCQEFTVNMARVTCNALAVLLFVSLFALTFSQELTCDKCISYNTTLILSCKNVTDPSKTSTLCAKSVTTNCTLKENCTEPVNPTVSESVISQVNSVSTSSLVPIITTSHSSNIPKPTPTSKPPNTKHPEPKKPGRRFDAASFIGGILLCGGVIFLVYIAVRCYKTKPNYSRLWECF